VVYSTCSIHDEENELVVKKALELGSAFHLVRVLPQFPSRGKNIIPNGDYCVRTTPEVDHTIGFFVSRFERNSEAINVDTKAANTNPKKRKTPEPVEKPLKTNEVAPRPPRESTTGTNAPNETTTHKKQKTQEDSASGMSNQPFNILQLRAADEPFFSRNS
jgi:putative methyltransferase